MLGNNIVKGITLTRTLDKISKVLGIANQAIPIYKEIKPLVNNTKKVFNVIKDFNKETKNDIKKTIDVKPIEHNSNLTFFQ